jgi:mono/diheme cytochrome c family protein
VYTKEQAERGKEVFAKACRKCHMAEGPATGQEEGPALAGDEFLKNWDGRSLFDLASQIRSQMPPDGSVTLEEPVSSDVVAYLLQVNKFPDGAEPLKTDQTARSITFSR